MRIIDDDPRDPEALAAAIREQMRRALLSGELTPGTRLAEAQLADIYGVGRSTIRDVLRSLAAERLVDLARNKGARVATPDAAEARRLFDLRRAIEAHALERAAHVARSREIRALSAMIALQRKSLAAGTLNRSLALVGDFHLQASGLACNQEITEVLAPLVARTSLIVAAFGGQRVVASAPDFHAEILNLVQEGRPAEAARAVERCLYRFEADIDFRRHVGQKRPIDIVLRTVR